MSDAYDDLILETLFVELSDEPGACRERIAAALRAQELAADVGVEPAEGHWSVGPPVADPNDPDRYGVEVFPPIEITLAPLAGWTVAHATEAALGEGTQVEPTFAGDVQPAAPESAKSGSTDGDPPVDVQWHLHRANVFDAHERLRQSGVEPGADIHIGHPDTGYTEHREIFGGTPNPIDPARGVNLLETGSPPIDPQHGGMLKHPGHGTSTASMAVARDGIQVDRHPGGTPVDLLGVAPAARVAPIRVTESVVLFGWQRRLARAIEHAVDAGCRVVSISLGGLGGSRLSRAVRYAEANGVIVVAAAGNEVGFVVAPATYATTVAAAASDVDDRPWSGSSSGRAVTITAPGHQVWVAGWAADRPIAKSSSGTSFSAALVAGAAAIWLSAHDAALTGRQSAAARLFRAALRASARTQPPLPSGFGAGFVDCDALVASAPPHAGQEAAEVLEPPERSALESLIGTDAPVLVATTAKSDASPLSPSLMSELAFHATLDLGVRDRLSAQPKTDAGTEARSTPAPYSPQLAEAMAASG